MCNKINMKPIQNKNDSVQNKMKNIQINSDFSSARRAK